MDTELAQLLLRMQADITKAIQESEARSGGRIDSLTEQVRIANGRTSKLETAVGIVTAKVRLIQRGSMLGSLSKKQKAVIGAVLVGAAEVLHQAIPLLLKLLQSKAGQ